MPIAPYSDLGGSTIIKNNITWHVLYVTSTVFRVHTGLFLILSRVKFKYNSLDATQMITIGLTYIWYNMIFKLY